MQGLRFSKETQPIACQYSLKFGKISAPAMSDFVKEREADKEIGKSLDGAPGQKAKRTTRQPLAIEVCCGHAGLSAALRIKGWDVRPIDWAGNEHERTSRMHEMRGVRPWSLQLPKGMTGTLQSPSDNHERDV